MKKLLLAFGILATFGLGQASAIDCVTANEQWNTCASQCISDDPAGCQASVTCRSQLNAVQSCTNSVSTTTTSTSTGGSIPFVGTPPIVEEATGLYGEAKGAYETVRGGARDFSILTGDILGVLGDAGQGIEDLEEGWDCIKKGLTNCAVTPEGSFELPDAELFNTIGQNVSLRQYILNVLNFVLSFLGLIAVAALIYAGFLYVTSGGDDSANEKSKKILIYAVIGILLILASFAIVNTVIRNAGVGTDDRDNISNIVDPETGAPVVPGTPGGVNVPGTPTTPGLINNLVNPIVIEGNNLQDGGDSVFVSLEDARAGLQFGLSVEAKAIIDFGDGTALRVDTGLNPNMRIPYAYGEAGTYRVRALVQTADGRTSGFEKNVVVGGLESMIQGPRTDILINTSTRFSGESSRSTQGTIVSYAWTCDRCDLSSSNQASTDAFFGTPGVFPVNLEVTNSLGQTSVSSVNVTVVSDQPIADFSGQSTKNSNRPSEFRFDAGDSMNIKGNKAGLTYYWTLDGVTRQTSSNQLVYNFPNPGSAEVSLYVGQVFDGQTLESETVSQTFDIPSTLSVDFDVY